MEYMHNTVNVTFPPNNIYSFQFSLRNGQIGSLFAHFLFISNLRFDYFLKIRYYFYQSVS